MTKLEQLIKELCPNGVEYKRLQDLAEISTGSSNTNEAIEGGKYPFFVRSQELLYKDEYEFDETAIITAGDGVGVGKVLHFYSGKYSLHQRAYRIHLTDKGLLPKFFYFYMQSSFYDYITKAGFHSSVSSIRRPMLNNYPVPVPPLEVQAEIVKILDEYTESVTALQQELEAELTARKKQYEYYRDLLLDFGGSRQTDAVHGGGTSECEWRTLGDVAEVTDYVANGSFASLRENVTYKRNPDFAALIRTVDFSNGFDRDQMIYIDENAYKFLEKSRLFGGEIIINNIGAGVGNSFLCPMLDIKMSLAPNAVMLKTNNNKFYFYWLNSKYGKNALSKIISKSAMPKFNKTGLRGIMIPVPPIKEQERIVAILDRFDKLCNDISEGLPAEIEARRKQYEYYRDKLLSFEEMRT